jgi:hypothetical protein
MSATLLERSGESPVVISFPGQSKEYPDAPRPEVALFRESVSNFRRLMATCPELTAQNS